MVGKPRTRLGKVAVQVQSNSYFDLKELGHAGSSGRKEDQGGALEAQAHQTRSDLEEN